MKRQPLRQLGLRRASCRDNPEYAEWVLDQVRERGPLGADALPAPEGVERRIPGSWVGTVPRAMLEAHFIHGTLAVAERRSDFSRVFDLSERLIAAEHHGRHRRTGRRASANCCESRRGRTASGRRRTSPTTSACRCGTRVRVWRSWSTAGELREVRVEGWREPAYLHPEAAVPERIDAASLLSPFDPLIWTRPRVARLFGFDYRVEIFVPPREATVRVSTCCRSCLGDRLVARVDLKADRPRRRLNVQGRVDRGRRRCGRGRAGAGERSYGRWRGWLGLDSGGGRPARKPGSRA